MYISAAKRHFECNGSFCLMRCSINRSFQNYQDDQTKDGDMVGECMTYGDILKSYENLVRKPEGKRSLGKLKPNERIILKLIYKELQLDEVDWIYLSHNLRTDGRQLDQSCNSMSFLFFSTKGILYYIQTSYYFPCVPDIFSRQYFAHVFTYRYI